MKINHVQEPGVDGRRVQGDLCDIKLGGCKLGQGT